MHLALWIRGIGSNPEIRNTLLSRARSFREKIIYRPRRISIYLHNILLPDRIKNHRITCNLKVATSNSEPALNKRTGLLVFPGKQLLIPLRRVRCRRGSG